MLLSQNFEYTERPAALILGRRGFLKVTGLCVAAMAVCGYAIGDLIARRGEIIKARQTGLYTDDLICQKLGLACSHQNPTVMQVYQDLGTKPVDEEMEELLHTHYYPRTLLAVSTQSEDHHE